MNWVDVPVIAVGLVIGWTIVSFLYRGNPTKVAAIPDSDMERQWPKILGVPKSASATEIDAAYEARLAELRHGWPSITTVEESEQYRKQHEALGRALKCGKRWKESS